MYLLMAKPVETIAECELMENEETFPKHLIEFREILRAKALLMRSESSSDGEEEISYLVEFLSLANKLLLQRKDSVLLNHLFARGLQQLLRWANF